MSPEKNIPDYGSMNRLLYEGKAPAVVEMTEQALADGRPAEEILQNGLIAGMRVVGEDFKHNRLYVPQVLVAARAMKAGLAILKPLLAEAGTVSSAGTIVIGTVQGDLHDIGKNLVCMMAEGAGYTVIDLGVDVKKNIFIDRVRESGAHILGMSALLTTTMPAMKGVIDEIRLTDGCESVKICVGGAPVSQMFAEEIGADGYAADAASAVTLFDQLTEKAVESC